MKAMLEMVTLKSRGGQKILSPIHLISLVDPKAKWLKAWLHGNIGRQMFFLLVEQFHENLLIKSGIFKFCNYCYFFIFIAVIAFLLQLFIIYWWPLKKTIFLCYQDHLEEKKDF